MKKTTLLLIILAFFATIIVAQNKERVNAFNYNKTAQQCIESAEQYKVQNRTDKYAKEMNDAKLYLNKAKEAIDLAAQNDVTKNDAKTWHYYGIIYYKIAAYPEFNELDTRAIEKSMNAFKKIGELDQNYYKDNYADIVQHIVSINSNYVNLGAINYDKGNYDQAIENYINAYEANSVIGKKDNEALLFAAQTAIKAKEYDKVIDVCQILLNNKYENPTIYQYLAIAYRTQDNDEKMLEFITIGREKFPEDENLINEQINAYLKLKREAEIIDQIKSMAKKQTENPIYHLILGTIYGNTESTLYNIDTALMYYNKAIEISPDNENAYINVGSMYIDKAAALYNTANELPIDKVKEYDETIAKAKSYDEKALPFVEKAYELVPGDEVIKQALKTLYVRLKMMDKAKALEEQTIPTEK